MIQKKSLVLREHLRLDDPLATRVTEIKNQSLEIMQDVSLGEVLSNQASAFEFMKNKSVEKKQ